MKKTVILLLVILNPILCSAQDTTRVLFVGNSITYFNNMPFTFEEIANSLDETTKVTMFAMGGTGFVDHAVNPLVFDLFRQGNWDFIVLQPGTYEALGESYPIEQTLFRAHILVDSIYRYNPCTKVLYYEVPWGVFGDTHDDLINYNNSMKIILHNLEFLSDSTQLFFAPVGEAFMTSYNIDQDVSLWNSYTDIHPNPRGSYLAACIFYVTMFQKPSLGSTVLSTITAGEAADFQELADNIVLGHLSDWRINTYYPLPDFSYTISSDTIFFNNQSHFTDSVFWDFGDGGSSQKLNPMHIYSSSGNYTISLTRHFHGCEQTVIKDINLSSLSSQDVGSKIQVKIYPNPVDKILYIDLERKENIYQFEIYNQAGVLFHKTDEFRINVSEYPGGFYFIKIINTKSFEIEVLKWVKS
ncbi:MAG: PKD domain-containing protein [Bacteroidales bacterium]|nr:PKD domain-containing protein [Bacteroidales bacterium]